MAIRYRNTRYGHVVTIPEPKEVEQAARNPDFGKKQAVHQLRTIVRMDASKRWERADSVPAEAANDEPKADGVHNVGGGWHEVVIGGEVVDKVRGAEAAQESYDAHVGGE